MKKIILLLSLLLATQNLFSQISTQISCIQPTSVQFQQEYNSVNNQPTDQSKLNLITLWLKGKCLQVEQAELLATLFYDDSYRYSFCTMVYSSLLNKQDYFTLFDSFHSLSYAFRFYDFVNQASSAVIVTPPPPPPPPTLSFPSYNYPSIANYSGYAGCNLPLSDNDFTALVTPLAQTSGEVARQTAINQFAQNNCISMSQLMMLSTFLNLEINRSAFLKANFIKVYDLGNYGSAGQVFTSANYKTDWNTWAAAQLAALSTPPPPPPCSVSESDMTSIMSSINKASFSSTKLSTAKQVVSAKKCFTVAQLKKLVALMSFSSDKLELTKYSYDFCSDKSNYYQMNDVLEFESDKTALDTFLKSKQ